MLEQLGPDLWTADGGIVSFFGFDYPTRMVVVRLADGGLWFWSPIELGRQTRKGGPGARSGAAPRQSEQASPSVPRRVEGEVSGREAVGDGIDDHEGSPKLQLFGNAGRRSAARLGRADRPILFRQLALPRRADLLPPQIAHRDHRRPVAAVQRTLSETPLAVVAAVDRAAHRDGRGPRLSADRASPRPSAAAQRPGEGAGADRREPERVVVAHGEIVRSEERTSFNAPSPGCCSGRSSPARGRPRKLPKLAPPRARTRGEECVGFGAGGRERQQLQQPYACARVRPDWRGAKL